MSDLHIPILLNRKSQYEIIYKYVCIVLADGGKGSAVRQKTGSYPLMPEKVTPSIRVFWKMKNRIITGVIEHTDIAIMGP